MKASEAVSCLTRNESNKNQYYAHNNDGSITIR